jgi:hypothetical protein
MRKRILTGALAAVAISALAMAPQASAAEPAPATVGTKAEAANVPVEITNDVKIRSTASSKGADWGTARFGETWDAICYTEGENVSLGGPWSNIWIQLDQWGPSNGFITELGVKNGHAGLPHC